MGLLLNWLRVVGIFAQFRKAENKDGYALFLCRKTKHP